jgi:hypothetical protein
MAIDTQRSTQSVQKVLSSYTVMFIYGVLITLMAAGAAWSFNHFYPLTYIWIRFLEYVGYISWAASLGTLGPQIWGESSFVQKVDRQLANILSLVGIFSFVMARELVPL